MKKLSPRENEVYKLLVKGVMIKQIAFDLGINGRTVSTYKRRILDKLKLENDYELLKFEMQKQQNVKVNKKNVWVWKC